MLEQILQQGYDASATGKPLRGPGAGQADKIESYIIDEEQGQFEPALLSAGEVVIPAHAVSMLGDGDSEKGAKLWMDIVKEVFRLKTGKNTSPPPMKSLLAKVVHEDDEEED